MPAVRRKFCWIALSSTTRISMAIWEPPVEAIICMVMSLPSSLQQELCSIETILAQQHIFDGSP